MLLRADKITKSFNNKNVVDDISFSLDPGEILCISGDSGSGKTTLLNICAGMLLADSGELFVNDTKVVDVSLFRNKVSYMPCSNSLLDALSVLENILVSAPKRTDIVSIFSMLNIEHTLGRYPYTLSSGEYKRVCMARCYLRDNPIVILDEPTSNLDSKSASLITEAIKDMKRKKGIIIATHDKSLLDLGDNKIQMSLN